MPKQTKDTILIYHGSAIHHYVTLIEPTTTLVPGTNVSPMQFSRHQYDPSCRNGVKPALLTHCCPGTTLVQLLTGVPPAELVLEPFIMKCLIW